MLLLLLLELLSERHFRTSGFWILSWHAFTMLTLSEIIS
jgi:hypothetical protein